MEKRVRRLLSILKNDTTQPLAGMGKKRKTSKGASFT